MKPLGWGANIVSMRSVSPFMLHAAAALDIGFATCTGVGALSALPTGMLYLKTDLSALLCASGGQTQNARRLICER